MEEYGEEVGGGTWGTNDGLVGKDEEEEIEGGSQSRRSVEEVGGGDRWRR